MRNLNTTLSDRQAIGAYVAGCVAVSVGVLLHIPMFLMARDMGYHLAGMPMDNGMLLGMFLIIAGVLVCAYGLLPRDIHAQRLAAASITISAPDDARLGPAHWRLMIVLMIALVIDVMKPASLGFTVPGMIREYGVSRATVSLVPFFALLGTVVGSIAWGAIADLYGRKASIMLAAIMFVGTSICGAMPSLAWNIGMCFMMGAAAGGMLPVTYALLSEMMPRRHRGWSLVLVGSLGAIGGYFAASGASAVLQPTFGWRILWLLNLPTGLTLVFLGRFIPESAKFLLARGRAREAARVMARFGAVARKVDASAIAASVATVPLKGAKLVGKLSALSLTALTWGLINFGLLLWLPGDLVAKGYSVGLSSRLIAESSLIALPTVFVVAALYHRWSTKGALLASIGVTLLGLASVFWLETGARQASPVLPVALLIVGSNAIIGIVLPYAAESFPMAMRGRAIGWVAACAKAGGLLAQALSIAALTPSMRLAAGSIIVPATLACVLVFIFGRETRGIDLRILDGDRGADS